MNDQLGTLDAHTRTLQFNRTYAHPIDKVWAAVSDNEHLLSWFPHRIVGDLLTPGAELHFESTGDGAPPFAGRVLRAEPPHLLEFLWGTDTIRFELHPDGGGCRFTLTDVFDPLGKAARDGAGWHTCLDFLEAALDGTVPSFTTTERWTLVHDDYVREFGPEASSIGPPGGDGQ
jgi:uncharacterized protein YndB with AHSA1/START domain